MGRRDADDGYDTFRAVRRTVDGCGEAVEDWDILPGHGPGDRPPVIRLTLVFRGQLDQEQSFHRRRPDAPHGDAIVRAIIGNRNHQMAGWKGRLRFHHL